MLRLIIVGISLILSAQAHAVVFSIGYEGYHLERDRDGGTHQDGWLNGGRVGAERFKPWGWYLGTDYLYAEGHLKGETGSGRALKSKLIDQIVEARLGFMFQQPTARCAYFIPFGGWGYFHEVNNFSPPSPLPCKFTDTFNYVVTGFLSGVNFNPLLSMGFNFKVRFMLDGESRVSQDPVLNNVTLIMENETQYRIEVPFTYTPCNSRLGTGLRATPFYEFRHFGGREGVPFNFRDTKFQIFGFKAAFTACF